MHWQCDAIANPDKGVMAIKNFDFVGIFTGTGQVGLADQGTLGMVFKKANPNWVAVNDNRIQNIKEVA